MNPSECHRTRAKNGTRHVERDGAIRFTLHITLLEGESNRVLDVEQRATTIFVKKYCTDSILDVDYDSEVRFTLHMEL